MVVSDDTCKPRLSIPLHKGPCNLNYILHYEVYSKPETASHTKLTIAAAVPDAMQNSTISYMADVDITKRFLIKTYNKLDKLCEVGVPEAISHILNIPDHYTD